MTTAWGGQPPNLNSTTQTHWGADSIGILGSVMKASWTSGEHGPSPLANDTLADGLEYRWYVDTLPVGCTIDATELGDAALSVPADGTYTWTYRLVESGVLDSTVGTVTTTVGVAGLTASVTGLASAVASALGAVTVVLVDPSDLQASAAGQAVVTAQATGSVVVIIQSVSSSVPITKRKVKVATQEPVTAAQRLDFQAIEDITFDYTSLLIGNETILAATSLVELRVGYDDDPDAILGDTPKTDGLVVNQRVTGRYVDTAYTLKCLANTSTGRRLVGSVILLFKAP